MRRRDVLKTALPAALTLAAAPSAFAAGFASDRFTVTIEGQGPDVILMPGLASSQNSYDAIAAHLRGTHRLHRLQVAGFAGAPPAGNAGTGEVVAPLVEDIAKYIKANNLKAPAFIGHSLGGESGIMLAERHPDLVGRLMVVDAFPFISVLFFGPTATPDSVRPQAVAIRDKTLAATDAERLASSTQTINTMVATEAARPAVLKATLDSDRSVSARAMYDLMVTDLTPDLKNITCPTTVLHAYNKYFPVPAETADSWYAAVYAGLKGVKLVRIEPSFHFIMLDQPQVFEAEVDKFLA